MIENALLDMRDRLTVERIEEWIRGRLKKAGDDLLIDAIPLKGTFMTFTDGALFAGRTTAGKHAIEMIGSSVGRFVHRVTPSERGAKWADRRAADLVVQISEGTRDALRRIVSMDNRRGIHPNSTAKAIRAVIGLDERRAIAVENYRLKLLDDGMSEDKVLVRTMRFAETKITERARVIARTESMAAVHEGRLDLWHELADAKVVPSDKIQREWVSARDERVDDECLELDGKTATLRGDFPGGAHDPPLHPQCRCTTMITVEGY
ncbi:MAG: phage minor head protein [Pseudomonadota bacterium]